MADHSSPTSRFPWNKDPFLGSFDNSSTEITRILKETICKPICWLKQFLQQVSLWIFLVWNLLGCPCPGFKSNSELIGPWKVSNQQPRMNSVVKPRPREPAFDFVSILLSETASLFLPKQAPDPAKNSSSNQPPFFRCHLILFMGDYWYPLALEKIYFAVPFFTIQSHQRQPLKTASNAIHHITYKPRHYFQKGNDKTKMGGKNKLQRIMCKLFGTSYEELAPYDKKKRLSSNVWLPDLGFMDVLTMIRILGKPCPNSCIQTKNVAARFENCSPKQSHIMWEVLCLDKWRNGETGKTIINSTWNVQRGELGPAHQARSRMLAKEKQCSWPSHPMHFRSSHPHETQKISQDPDHLHDMKHRKHECQMMLSHHCPWPSWQWWQKYTKVY